LLGLADAMADDPDARAVAGALHDAELRAHGATVLAPIPAGF
jgi:hypothetical protein